MKTKNPKAREVTVLLKNAKATGGVVAPAKKKASGSLYLPEGATKPIYPSRCSHN